MSKSDSANQALISPAATRNRDAILAVLQRVLPRQGRVLEVASGTGQHIAYFAAALPALTWQASDADLAALGSISAHIAAAELANAPPPLHLDVHSEDWLLPQADAVLCCNMIHIAPWSATLGLVAGAARLLTAPGAPLILYGPYRRGGRHTAASNASFDVGLKSRDRRWGVRDLEEVTAAAAEQGLVLDEIVPMPANNFTVVYRHP